jgi:hypothetical protein
MPRLPAPRIPTGSVYYRRGGGRKEVGYRYLIEDVVEKNLELGRAESGLFLFPQQASSQKKSLPSMGSIRCSAHGIKIELSDFLHATLPIPASLLVGQMGGYLIRATFSIWVSVECTIDGWCGWMRCSAAKEEGWV